MIIRNATIADAEDMLAIYAPYVEETAITFEYDVPGIEEFRQRIQEVTTRYPWLVAEQDGCIVGYAYAGTFYDRAAYQWTVETSIYLDRKKCGQGIGRQLHKALENTLRNRGFQNMNACIAYIEPQDEYLTLGSVRFHERMGYRRCAHFHQCGFKFGRWYDIVWMEKMIGDHKNTSQ